MHLLALALVLAMSNTSHTTNAAQTAADLPVGGSPEPVPSPQFPDRLHAFIWRNWQLVPAQRLADVVGAHREDIVRIGRAMGLDGPPRISSEQQRRSYLTVIRRNWHLLPYDQLLALLGWTPDELAYALREDDFLYVKLGNLKPRCAPLRFSPPDEAARTRERQIAAVVRETFPRGVCRTAEPLFAFVKNLPQLPAPQADDGPTRTSAFRPRYCYSYFALYGDPLLDTKADPYPDGYLARLAACGVDGVWMQAVLYKLAPFPWDPRLSTGWEARLRNLRRLVARARRHGIGVYLYLNEPRAMPVGFFGAHPELKGAVEGDHAALCTSAPSVQRYMTASVESVCRAVPDLAGLFTITASENLSNCWSHFGGAGCPRCSKRTGAEVVAEVNGLVQEGIRRAGSKARLIAWDWGWPDDWAAPAIAALPAEAALMSVSEWSLPIRRGGVESAIGEYSISAVGPGPRALRNWRLARDRGLRAIAKVQAGNTWELSAVPYIPAVANVAQHAANLRAAGVDGLMLGWTLGGCPSPNLEVVAEVARQPAADGDSAQRALATVAQRRFGAELAPTAVRAWREMSAAFGEFPYHPGTVYQAPLQVGPANPLWERPTGYHATMVGFPYDDVAGWRSIYPPQVFAVQLEKVAAGFERGASLLRGAAEGGGDRPARGPGDGRAAMLAESDVAEAAAIHFRSVANQTRFVVARDAIAAATNADEAGAMLDEAEALLRSEMALAVRLHGLQGRDSRLGFEASNHYYYVPTDLAEKVLACRDLLDRWLPQQRARLAARK